MGSETPAMYHGSLVALEGAPEVVSTQLRLLPTSPQLLILPGIHHYATKDDQTDEPFDARAFIRRIHEAVSARREAALKFLEDSSPTRKRLVFLNGGTPSAQAMCISAISEHETNGDVPMAEAIFADLVRDGVAGLSRKPDDGHKCGASRRRDSELNLEEALTRAMLAAEALDRETEGLQPDDILDLTNIRGRPRSLSLPIYGFSDPFDENTPFYVFGAGDGDDDTVPETPALDGRFDGMAHKTIRGRIQTPLTLEFPEEKGDKRPSGCEDDDAAGPPKSPSCIGEAYLPLTPLSPIGKSILSARSDLFCSPPPTPAMSEKVVFGEARVVQMRYSYPGRTIKKTRSLDDLGETPSKALASSSSPPRACAAHPSGPSTPTKTKARETSPSRRHSLLELSSRQPWTPPPQKSNFLEVPQAKFVKASKTTIRRPVAHLRLNLHPRNPPPTTNPKYVDRGTDAADWAEETTAEASSSSSSLGSDDVNRPFEPVLSLTEDLVIRFTDGVPDKLLDSIIQGLKLGAAAAAASQRPATPDDDLSELDAFPATPTSPHFPHLIAPKPKHHHHPHHHKDSSPPPPPTGDSDEYDPFASDGSYSYNASPWVQPTAMPTITAPQPPTPAQTPPPPPLPSTPREPDPKFHDFSVAGRPTAVRVQNALRSVLSGYFPPGEDAGYHHCHFPLLPDMGRLWKPIFGEAEPASPRPDGRKTDLILAIGAQKGVAREFLSSVTAQIEKLGTKSNGVTRSGRLDLRFLIVHAMQTFTAQPLANQTQDNPFTNPLLLATLIIPHLETYLTSTPDVRFLLLEYPAEHLATVLALQKLVGVDMFKVAGVVDGSAAASASAEPAMPFARRAAHSKQPSIQGLDSLATCKDLTFSKANLLVTSSATAAEVATFVATIRNILADISHFYVPATPPKPPSPTTSSSTIRTKVPTGMPATPPPPPPLSPLPPRVAAAMAPLSRPASPAPSTKSRAASIRTARSGRAKSRGGASTISGVPDPYAIFDIGPEDDEDLDAELRRLMPLFTKRREVRKGNSRKALKWLGLA